MAGENRSKGGAMARGIAPFESDDELLDFAEAFLQRRIGGFRKDMAICLTADATAKHAYFPALMTCVSFLELMGGLYSGNLGAKRVDDLWRYGGAFLDRRKYKDLYVALLYEGFRHKIAHLGDPYYVFDTSTRPKVFQRKMLVAWTVYVRRRRDDPFELKRVKKRPLRKFSPPWPVPYDHRIIISINRLRVDLPRSVYGPKGYLERLAADPRLRENFARCIKEIFPPQ
jgi:hypothetical protein